MVINDINLMCCERIIKGDYKLAKEFNAYCANIA